MGTHDVIGHNGGTPFDDDEALDARLAAAFLGYSVATHWRKVKDGTVSKPFYPAERTPRWTNGQLRRDRERLRMTPAEHKQQRRAKKLAAAKQFTAHTN
jgi:hypothetical protein